MKKTVNEKIAALRQLMKQNNVDIYLIVSEDFHGSEYVGDYFKCRAFMTGFTGSAGSVVVTKDFAGLWTDGRYFLQAKEQLKDTEIELMKMGIEGVPDVKTFIADHLEAGGCLGFDGRTIPAQTGLYYKELCESKGGSVNGQLDLAGEIWTDRPDRSQEPAWLLDLCYAGVSREEKLHDLRQVMEEKKADYFILSSLDDIAWLLNIRGNDVLDNPVLLSYVLVSKTGCQLFANPAAFPEKDQAQLREAGITFEEYDAFYDALRALPENASVFYDGERICYAILEALPENIVQIDDTNPTMMAKAIKNKVEMENIRKAHIKDGVAVVKFMYWLKHEIGHIPMDEISVAEKLESFRKEQPGYIEPSFEPICGYGPHGAIVHYSATKESCATLKPEGLLLMDTGAQFMEGTTDITRTYVLGPVTDEEKKFFTLILKGALNLGGANFLYGCKGINLDYLAREPLWQMNMDYQHGTGHGVGYLLNVHEGPNGIRWRSLPGKNEGAILEEGMLTSNEPGVYIEGKFGVRHENLMLCVKGEKNFFGQFMHFETVTMVPFDLDGVDPDIMTEREKMLLNQYHQTIFETISPYLTKEESQWLREATRPVK